MPHEISSSTSTPLQTGADGDASSGTAIGIGSQTSKSGGTAAALVVVAVLLVAAMFAVRHYQKRSGVAANAVVVNELHQEEDRRNTLQMEENPMAAANRAAATTTAVQNPTFKFHRGRTINGGDSGGGGGGGATPQEAAYYANPESPALHQDAAYYEIGNAASASASAASSTVYATYAPTGGASAGAGAGAGSLVHAAATYAIPLEIGSNGTNPDGVGHGGSDGYETSAADASHAGGIVHTAEGEYSSYAAAGAVGAGAGAVPGDGLARTARQHLYANTGLGSLPADSVYNTLQGAASGDTARPARGHAYENTGLNVAGHEYENTSLNVAGVDSHAYDVLQSNSFAAGGRALASTSSDNLSGRLSSQVDSAGYEIVADASAAPAVYDEFC